MPRPYFPAANRSRGGRAVCNDRRLAALCQGVGAPHLAREPRFATSSDRVALRPYLRTLTTGLLGEAPAGVRVDRLSAAGVPVGPVNDIAEAFALADRLALEPTVAIGGMSLPRSPIRLPATPVTYRCAPPAPVPEVGAR